jgi:hypothetical protein
MLLSEAKSRSRKKSCSVKKNSSHKVNGVYMCIQVGRRVSVSVGQVKCYKAKAAVMTKAFQLLGEIHS